MCYDSDIMLDDPLELFVPDINIQTNDMERLSNISKIFQIKQKFLSFHIIKSELKVYEEKTGLVMKVRDNVTLKLLEQ